ncbi:MAG: T9SS type A sorting domain-containing protein, partial [Bacteroidia bacterium]|nr:T9SS type A sorting domain-containing protein [Bacteroidia bacterium]
CTTVEISGCQCPDSTTVNCDLLPDMTISRQILMAGDGYTENPQKNSAFGFDDGRLRMSVMTPNIGFGPLEIRATNLLICGSDTFSTGYNGKCSDGDEPKQIVLQRIYHKSADSISWVDHILGAMPFNPLSTSSIKRFEYLSLRLKNIFEPDPRKWPLVAGNNKNSFCLEDQYPCSFSPGACRNINDSILLDDDFPNFGVCGYYDCSTGIQGISSGYADTYVKNLYGMWIDIPPGTCNGNDYYLVLEIDPDNIIIESDKSNNMIAVPITLTKQDNVGNPTAIIYPDGCTTICSGDSLKLTATAAYSYKWSTGDTMPHIYAKSSGTYSVILTSPCGTTSSEPLVVNMLDPPPLPVVIGDTLCIGDSAKLSANSPDSLVWYDAAKDGKIVSKGNSFVTPPLVSSTTFYVQSVKSTKGIDVIAGRTDTSGSGKFYKGLSYMVFDCISPFTINAITIYAKDTSTITISISDGSGYTLNAKKISLVKGKNRIPLGFTVTRENNYILYLKSNSTHEFYGNYTDVNYPYVVPGVISIKTSGLGKSDYTCLYNWEIKTANFYPASARIPVSAIVDNTCIQGARFFDTNILNFSITPNPFTDKLTIKSGGKIGVNSYLVICDLTGQIIKTEKINSNGISIINRDFLADGIYFYKVFGDSAIIAAGKLIAR